MKKLLRLPFERLSVFTREPMGVGFWPHPNGEVEEEADSAAADVIEDY